MTKLTLTLVSKMKKKTILRLYIYNKKKIYRNKILLSFEILPQVKSHFSTALFRCTHVKYILIIVLIFCVYFLNMKHFFKNLDSKNNYFSKYYRPFCTIACQIFVYYYAAIENLHYGYLLLFFLFYYFTLSHREEGFWANFISFLKKVGFHRYLGTQF